MKQAQTFKVAAITPPGAILDNTSATTLVVDTIGFSYAVVLVHLGATDIAMTALKLQHSDVAASSTALTSGVDITGADFTAALPSATSDNGFFAFYVDLKGLGRYLDLVATVGDGSAGTYFTASALLFEGSITPSSATARGLLAQLIV
jgi:hypothetical protein